MSDFAQPGLICTLQRLNPEPLLRLGEELTELSADRPIALILPCHARDLSQPALRHICSELRQLLWLRRVVVSMNGLDAEGAQTARRFFSQELLQPHSILWNDGPVLSKIYAECLDCLPSELPHGKGLNVWAAIGLLCAEGGTAIAATQDCDVASFSADQFVRLCYACASPSLGFTFAKMYYPRVTDRLYGRASRLFLAPLLQALIRISGHHPLLDFLTSFRYPLAGEMALSTEIAQSLPISPGWGLEIGMLCEIFRSVDPVHVCQVDGGSGYDHRHQAVDRLDGMCGEVARTLLAELAAEGISMRDTGLETLATAYLREAARAIQRSSALAQINDLPFHAEGESAIVQGFCCALQDSLSQPQRLVLPPWARLLRANGDLGRRFAECV